MAPRMGWHFWHKERNFPGDFSASTAMAAAEPSSSDSPPAPLRRHPRRLVFDRRYGWIFDEWTDPAAAALSGGRGMFCVLPMASALVNAAVSSVNCAADSVSKALTYPESFSPVAYIPHLPVHKKQQTWFRDLKHCGVIADAKLIPCRTHCTLECVSTNCH